MFSLIRCRVSLGKTFIFYFHKDVIRRRRTEYSKVVPMQLFLLDEMYPRVTLQPIKRLFLLSCKFPWVRQSLYDAERYVRHDIYHYLI